MRRVLLGWLLILHGIGHAAIGVWAGDSSSLVVINTLWAMAIVGYCSAGLGLLRVPLLRHQWKVALVAGTILSSILLLGYGGLIGLLGIPIDLVLVFLAVEVMERQVDSAIEAADVQTVANLSHPALHRFGWSLALIALFYVAIVTLMRPVYLHYGTTPAERAARLPGDELVRDPTYRVDHAITVRAPADSVWPWLVQLGQDRGGFYSYSSLENFFGDRIVNADRVHAEWQTLAVGDTIRATQPDFLGGRLGTLGWKVKDIVPGRALILENWGAFVLQPVDSATTRLIVRTRGEGKPTIASFLLGPINVFMFEPAHLIMQRGMLQGVRDRAEHARAAHGG
jgi:hypothetical protein